MHALDDKEVATESQSVFDICNFAIAGESQSVIRVNSDSTPLGGGGAEGVEGGRGGGVG